MTKLEALTELAAKVEAGERFIDTQLVLVFGKFGPPEDGSTWYARNAYHGSLDAAKALHDAVLPGWDAYVSLKGRASVDPECGGIVDSEYVSNNPARAWLLAIIRALIAQERTQSLQDLADADRDLL